MPFYSELSLTVTEAAGPDNHNIEKTSKVSITISPKIYSGIYIIYIYNAEKFWNVNQSIPKSKKQQKNTNVKKNHTHKTSTNRTALNLNKLQRN